MPARLVAEGTTTLAQFQHVDRGYPRFVKTLVQVGADVVRTELPDMTD